VYQYITIHQRESCNILHDLEMLAENSLRYNSDN